MSPNIQKLKQKEIRLNDWCVKHDIKRFLFDLDDTICPTRQIFREIMSQAFDFMVLHDSSRTREEWKTDVEEINNRLFEKVGVNSNRWNLVVDEISEKYKSLSLVSTEIKEIFQKIYKTPLTMFDGAEEGMQIIKQINIPIGIVTHASKEWTMMKYDWLGLDRFVSKSEIYVVDQDGHKTSDSWKEAIKYFGHIPTDCVVIGDSPRSDINPAMEAGVKYCFLVEDENIWSIHNVPIKQEVKKIKALNQIVEVI